MTLSLPDKTINESIRRVGQVVENFDVAQIRVFFDGFSPVARSYQNRPRARGTCRLDVDDLIPHEINVVQRQAKSRGNIQQHTGVGFETGAVVLGQTRTDENRLDVPTDFGELTVHGLVDPIERHDIEQPARKAGLICCDDDAESRTIQPRDGVETAGNGDPLFRRADVARRVLVDDAVAIEYDEIHVVTVLAAFVQSAPTPICGIRAPRRGAGGRLNVTPAA